MGRVEIPQRSSLPRCGGVLSFWSEAREALLVKRREFITLLGGVAAAAWPLAARAQQGVRQITVWMGRGNDAEGQRHAAAFRETLRALGWADGRNVRTHYHWVTGDINNLQITIHQAEGQGRWRSRRAV